MFSLALTAHQTLIAGVIVQFTSTFILALLGWSDRRSKGMPWLAAASALDAFAIVLRGAPSHELSIAWEAAVTAVFLLSGLCAYMGLHWFARLRKHASYWPAAVLFVVAATLSFDLFAPHVTLMAARLTMMALLLAIAKMAWATPERALRPVMRTTACFLWLVIVLRLGTLAIDFRSAYHLQITHYGNESLLGALIVLDFLFVAIFAAETKRRLHEETRLDSLTGLRNRRAIEETAEREVARANSLRQPPLSLLMLDLDRFKVLNDTWGHGMGDRALRAVSNTLVANVGSPESLARLGGEEFAVLLSDVDLHGAARIAEKLRAAIEEMRLEMGTDICKVTVSIGASSLHPGELDWIGMMRRADKALYRAKNSGRNRVVLCDHDPVVPEPEQSTGPQRLWRRVMEDQHQVL
jgi:diguanylate cyclase (GGDEF)-like protein